ncbi:MAG: nitroreductase family protein [Verrucomicrobiae bacterium]|nr:nitroreductase family protein [Verrucomicrobiae bacterium]
MDALRAIKTRCSVRVYQKKPIARKVLEDIVDCARLAATARNIQPWEFVVVTDEVLRGRIADLTEYGKHIARAPACIAVFCQETKYYLEDGSAATQNILLAATARGVGSCWVAGDKKPFADDVRRLLGLPETFKLVSLVALGYPAEKPRREKRPLREVLHWQRFGGAPQGE